ncbi:MAG: hypothetical protein ABIR56_09690, partial [Polaromonas sp.]
ADPGLVDWSPADTQFVAARISSSNDVVVGGALAYRYAADGTLANVGYSAAMAQLTAAGFGSTPQTMAFDDGSAGAQAPSAFDVSC